MKPSPSRRRIFDATALVAVLSLWSMPVVALAEVVDIAWGEGQRFEQSLIVPPGKFAELCGAFKPGQTITWSFEAEAALNFNIHFHLGKDVRFPSQIERTHGAQGELLVDSAQDYCWMWTNKAAKPTRLRVSLALK